MNNWGEVDLDKLYEQMLDSVYGPRSAQGTRGQEVVGTFNAAEVDVNRVTDDPEVVAEVRRMTVGEGGSLARRRGGTRAGHKRKTVTIVMDEDSWRQLKEVAKEFNLWYGGDGNISALMQLIGEGKLKVVLQE